MLPFKISSAIVAPGNGRLQRRSVAVCGGGGRVSLTQASFQPASRPGGVPASTPAARRARAPLKQK